MVTYTMTGDGHWIDEVIDSGRFIVLEDGSRWEISPFNVLETCIWLPVTDITVEEGADPFYPYRLINTEDGEIVDARYVGSN